MKHVYQDFIKTTKHGCANFATLTVYSVKIKVSALDVRKVSFSDRIISVILLALKALLRTQQRIFAINALQTAHFV